MAVPFKFMRSLSLVSRLVEQQLKLPSQKQIFSAHIHSFTRCNKDIEHTTKKLDHNEYDQETEDVKIRLKILDAAIQFVPEYGWSKEALAAGAESIGLPGVAHGMVRGGEELVLNFNYFNNRKLFELLGEKYEDRNKSKDLHLYFNDALKTRLEMIIPVSKRWSEAMSLMLQPQCFADDLELLLDLSKVVWFYTGDKNVYLKWYTKRLSLALAYRLSELCLAQDNSPDFSETWEFLQTQVEKVIKADQSVDQIDKVVTGASGNLGGALITLRNMIGANIFR